VLNGGRRKNEKEGHIARCYKIKVKNERGKRGKK
jgi:hypothetical protein